MVVQTVRVKNLRTDEDGRVMCPRCDGINWGHNYIQYVYADGFLTLENDEPVWQEYDWDYDTTADLDYVCYACGYEIVLAEVSLANKDPLVLRDVDDAERARHGASPLDEDEATTPHVKHDARTVAQVRKNSEDIAVGDDEYRHDTLDDEDYMRREAQHREQEDMPRSEAAIPIEELPIWGE